MSHQGPSHRQPFSPLQSALASYRYSMLDRSLRLVQTALLPTTDSLTPQLQDHHSLTPQLQYAKPDHSLTPHSLTPRTLQSFILPRADSLTPHYSMRSLIVRFPSHRQPNSPLHMRSLIVHFPSRRQPNSPLHMYIAAIRFPSRRQPNSPLQQPYSPQLNSPLQQPYSLYVAVVRFPSHRQPNSPLQTALLPTTGIPRLTKNIPASYRTVTALLPTTVHTCRDFPPSPLVY
ncbi:hypothetical protein BKA82DRAFT_4013809 [Pisolithus tinctorius]|nr:hypothetical protein BKA82DRAFT_4013809 [Pisolithus tinctorius]